MLAQRIQQPAVANVDEPAMDPPVTAESLRVVGATRRPCVRVEDPGDQFAQESFRKSSSLRHWRQQWVHHCSFHIGQVVRIAKSRALILTPYCRGAHRGIHPRCRNVGKSRPVRTIYASQPLVPEPIQDRLWDGRGEPSPWRFVRERYQQQVSRS